MKREKRKIYYNKRNRRKYFGKKLKKNYSIDIGSLKEIKLEYETSSNNPIEVKDKIFNDIENVYKEITCSGKTFIEECIKQKIIQ